MTTPTFKALLKMGFADADARRLALRSDDTHLPGEVLALCKAAVTASGRTVAPKWGGTAHGLAAAFVMQGADVDRVRAVLHDSLRAPQTADVWALRAAQIEAAR